MLSYLHGYTMKRGLRKPLQDYPTRDHRHSNTVLQCQMHQASPFSTSSQHPHQTAPNQINRSQAWQSQHNTWLHWGTPNVCPSGASSPAHATEERSFFCHASRTFFLGAISRVHITQSRTGLCLQSHVTGVGGFHIVFTQNTDRLRCFYNLVLSWV